MSQSMIQITGRLIEVGNLESGWRGIALDVDGEDVELRGLSEEDARTLASLYGQRVTIAIAAAEPAAQTEANSSQTRTAAHSGALLTDIGRHSMIVGQAVMMLHGIWTDSRDYIVFNNEKITRAEFEERAEAARVWSPLAAAGQVRVGDRLRFTIGDEAYSETVCDVLLEGTPHEEIIYNVRKNFYIITSMALAGTSSQKGVEVGTIPA